MEQTITPGGAIKPALNVEHLVVKWNDVIEPFEQYELLKEQTLE